MEKEQHRHLHSGQNTIAIEADALIDLAKRLDSSFIQAVEVLLACKGRIIVTGIGKSGHIGRKIAATLASTGSPAFFVHSAEAVHGDLGMITGDDVVIAISYSGQSDELSIILPVVKRLGTKIIAICGDATSNLAKLCDIFINIHVSKEACPLGLAPTASTTATLALGDALAIACLEARNFGASDFARSHPGGALGRRLLTHVSDIMRKGDDLPIVSSATPVTQALIIMSDKRMGMTIVTDNAQKPIGIFTDGDLRRLIQVHGDIRPFHMREVMTKNPKTITGNALAVDAATVMEQSRLTHILVVDTAGLLIGALHMHDLMTAKVI